MEQIGLKVVSRDLQVNCAISYLFYLYLMFYACVIRFDVMENLVKFWVFECIKMYFKNFKYTSQKKLQIQVIVFGLTHELG